MIDQLCIGEANVSRSYRLAVLMSHPVQYFVPLSRQLAKQSQIDLTVYFCSRWGVQEYEAPDSFAGSVRWDIPLLEGYCYKFLPNLSPLQHPKSFWSFVNPTITKELFSQSFDALWINGYWSFSNWIGMFAAWGTDTPIFYRSESHLAEGRRRRTLRWASRIKPLGLEFIFSRVEAFLTIGTRNADLYRHYGVPEENLFFTPYSVDNDYFQQEAQRWRPKRSELRARWGVHDDRPIVLFCGRLTPKKRPELLLEAFARVRQDHRCALLYAGDGELRSVIERTVIQNEIPDVHITGFLNQSEITQAYVAADFLVLPSAWAETWGLVVNEAMNTGLPIIVSNRVGCAPDLVKEGENGFIFEVDNVEQLASFIALLIQNPEWRCQMGQCSREIIATWSNQRCVEGILAALDSLKR